MATKTALMNWIDTQLRGDPQLARAVEERLNEMRIEQQLVALREKRGLSQRDFAKLLGTSQPYVAKLESGRIKNLGVRTLLKCATALGGRLTLRIEPQRKVKTTRSRTRRPLADTDRESLAVSTSPKFIAILERSRARCKPGSGISTEEMRRRLALRRKRERKIG